MDVSRIGLIKSLSDSQLVEMSRKQDKPDEALFALGELGRRNDRREAVAMQMGKAPTIADQEREKAMMQEPMMQEPMMQEPVMMAAGGGLVNQGIGAPPINPDMISPDMIAGIGSPDMMPQPQPIGSGVGQLPAPMMMAAGGGLIELAGGGEIIPYQNEGLVEGGVPYYEQEDYVPFSEKNMLQRWGGFIAGDDSDFTGDMYRSGKDYRGRLVENPFSTTIDTIDKGLIGTGVLGLGRMGLKGALKFAKDRGLGKKAMEQIRKLYRKPRREYLDLDAKGGPRIYKEELGRISPARLGLSSYVGLKGGQGIGALMSDDEAPQEGTAITSPVPSPNELMRERLQGMKTTAEEEAAKEAERKELAERGIAATLADKGIGAETILELGLRMMGDKDTTGGILGNVGRAGTATLTNLQARKEKAAERASEDRYRKDILDLKEKALDTDLKIASNRLGWKPKDVSDQFFEFSQSPEATLIRKNIKEQFEERADIAFWPIDRDIDDITDEDGNTLGQAQELAVLQGFRTFANQISGISGGANFRTQLENEIRSRTSG